MKQLGNSPTLVDALQVRAEKVVFLKKYGNPATEKTKEAQQVIAGIDYLIEQGVIKK